MAKTTWPASEKSVHPIPTQAEQQRLPAGAAGVRKLQALRSEQADDSRSEMKALEEYAAECSMVKVYASEMLDYVGWKLAAKSPGWCATLNA